MAISKRRKRRFLPSEVVTDIFARLPLETLGNVMLVNKFCLRLIAHLKQKEMAISNLPPEILTSIFARLSVETLSNVILVNKFYLQLISSREFARAHLKYLKQGNNSLSDYKLLFGTSYKNLLLQISLESWLYNSRSMNVVDLDFPKNGLRSPAVRFEGSCDGLVCLVLNRKYVFLWNPCTGKHKQLPRLIPNLDSEEKFIHITYGLGHDESTDDFKVVAICSKYSKTFPKDYEVYVFSLKTNSWKRILQDLKCNVPQFCTGKLICGKLHWMSGGPNMDDTKKIVSFDVESEVFGIVDPPSNYKDGCCKMTLDVLKGCLCLLISYENNKYVDLWVLKEYGVNESWTKVVTISCVGVPDYYISVVMVLPNGEILVYDDPTFVVYNPKEDSYRRLSIQRLDHNGVHPVFYVPSLVSPVV